MNVSALYSSTARIKHISSHYQNIQTYLLTKRWAGHSKWQNIKHTKALNDLNKSAGFARLSKKIAAAVKAGGENPELNFNLKMCIEEARKISMPNSTIQNAIKKATMIAEKPYWLIYSRPDGLFFGFEVVTPNALTAVQKINQYAKRLSLKHDKTPNTYVEKSVILCDSVEGGYDKAVEDGINIGVDEVEETGNNTVAFQCLPHSLDAIYKQLVEKGYKVQSASTEIEFPHFVKIKKDEEKVIETVLEKLSILDEIIRIVNNIERE